MHSCLVSKAEFHKYCSSGAQPRGSAYYGRGNLTILLDNVKCTGNETNIDYCRHNPWTTNNCGHNEDVGVLCVQAGKKPNCLEKLLREMKTRSVERTFTGLFVPPF